MPLIGMQRAQKTVSAMIAGHSPVHAILLYGAAGAGKTALAERLAKAWLCPNATEAGACEDCGVCRSFDEGRAVDFQRIVPLGPSRIIKQACIIEDQDDKDFKGVAVLNFFRTRPLMSKYKVVLFEEAERMNGAAATALLKTLEEPDEHVRMILTTSAISRIMPTILSRCVAIACELPGEDETRALLGDLADYEQIFSEGAPGMVLGIRGASEAYCQLFEVCENLLTAPPGAALKLADRFRASAELLDDKLKLGARGANTEALRCLALWVAIKMPDHPHRLQAVIETHRRIIGNANPSAVFDALFITLLN